jgi:predicted metal-dependent enzyme (double-stranded beta helix superfamily)
MEAPLAPEVLVAIAAEWAASVTLSACPVLRAHERAYDRVTHERDHDVWVIHWGPGSGLEPHDHGPSAGAFYVARGQLVEIRHDAAGGPLGRHVARGDARTFRAGEVHEVCNRRAVTASSIHVYSPPLTDMTFPAGEPRSRLEVVPSAVSA